MHEIWCRIVRRGAALKVFGYSDIPWYIQGRSGTICIILCAGMVLLSGLSIPSHFLNNVSKIR
jgi:hypothetical protein